MLRASDKRQHILPSASLCTHHDGKDSLHGLVNDDNFICHAPESSLRLRW